MAAYSRALAAASGWGPEECRQLELAAPMHDIGKLAIPDAILRKPAKLDTQEWAVMQTHASVGYKILSKSAAPLLRMAATIAHCHHEKWDGSGYPLAWPAKTFRIWPVSSPLPVCLTRSRLSGCTRKRGRWTASWRHCGPIQVLILSRVC